MIGFENNVNKYELNPTFIEPILKINVEIKLNLL